MNSDFPRIISLLRKERGISQKNAAKELGISQALLSHYEKGIRECGLDFLVRTADYYNVSCDYLLGRSADPGGRRISYEEIPEPSMQGKESLSPGGMMAAFNRKLVVNSLNVLFSLIQKSGSERLVRSSSDFLMLAVYKMFRAVYLVGGRNDERFFNIPPSEATALSDAAMNIAEVNALMAAKTAECEDPPAITAASLSDEYHQSAFSLLNVIKNSEATINNSLKR